MAEPEGDEDVIDWDLALDEVVRDGTLAPHWVDPGCVWCSAWLTTAVVLLSRAVLVSGDQGDGEWEFVLDMVSELFLAVLQHVKSALQGIVEYRKRGADMTWDEFLATANVRGHGLPPGGALNSHVAAGCVHARRRSTSQHTRSRARRARCTARL